MSRNVSRLLEQQEKGKMICVRYYEDSDPSGESMTADDSRLVRLLDRYDIGFERIAIDEIL